MTTETVALAIFWASVLAAVVRATLAASWRDRIAGLIFLGGGAALCWGIQHFGLSFPG